VSAAQLAPRTNRDRSVVDADELTPIDWHDGVAYKRDDLFMPYADLDLSGGKVRQMIRLVETHEQTIRDEYDATLLSATGVDSPQGLIVARVAAAYAMSCVLFVATRSYSSAITRYRMLRRAACLGATIDTAAPLGYEPVLARRLDEYRAEHGGYPIRFGIAADTDSAALLDTTAAQAANIPDDVTTVVVPVGAGITAAGILAGVRDHCPHVTRVVLVQVCGYDRRETIERLAPNCPYEWHAETRWQYHHQLRRRVDELTFDPIYEAKAHAYMTDRLDDLPRGRTLFWCIGNSAHVR